YMLTWAAAPAAPSTIVRGRWWTPAEAAARPRVSVEDEAAKFFGVDVGGTLTFDIQGVTVRAEVMSLRKVEWQSLAANFFMILSPIGATRWAIARAFAVEYACLGAVAGLGGTLLAAVLVWIVVRFVLDAPWALEPEPLLLGVILTTGVSLAVGLLVTLRLLGRKPLAVLRQE